MYSIFQIQGGLGKHIAATAVAKAIKNNHPERKLIVVCAYAEIFINLPFVDRVFVIGNTPYFYQEYVEDKDPLIFSNEPYFTTDHVNKRLPLIQTWCKMYDLNYNGEQPELIFNALQKNAAKEVWVGDKPTMILHTNGGLMTTDAKPYMWARDMPMDLAREIVARYKDKYTIFHCTKLNSPQIEDTITIWFKPGEMELNQMEYLSLLLYSDKRILIDSSLQHAAAALNLPSVVLWNATSPKVFGYDIHTNIETEKPHDFKLPNSYLFDFDFMGQEHEYPFLEEGVLFDKEKIFQAIDT
jgi:hypothetical protein